MKTILVVGASSDIGMAYIKRLETTNNKGEVQVIAHYRTMSKEFEGLVASAKIVQVEAIQADLNLPDDVRRLIELIKEKYTAPTHILHLAAGKFQHMRLRQFDSALTREEMEIQLFSLAEIFKAFLPEMSKKRYGKVVVMLTAYTIGIPPKFMANYCICKYALLGLMKAAASEYCDKGLCINGISPSMVETKFLDGIDKKVVEMTAESSPLKRNTNKEEVIAAIEFLMSDENSYMCGTNLNLSGGGR